MAVYTHVSPSELNDFLGSYDVGSAISFKGIAEGVENSNYLLKTTKGSFILTLYEKRVDASDLPYFLGLMNFIAGRGVKSARPVLPKSGNPLGHLCGRPAALIEFLDGVSADPPSALQCENAGAALAQLHLAGADFAAIRANHMGPQSWSSLLGAAAPRADTVQAGLASLLNDELLLVLGDWPQNLPQGIIHGDLFPDNVLFAGDDVSGLIDFYFACTDALAYDLAVMINAWCFAADGTFEADKSAILIKGYQSLRKLEASEIAALPMLARGAALRFVLTRLNDWLARDAGALVTPKDPLALLPHLRFHGTANPSAYGV